MPELLVDFITSLDGYGAGEGWPGWWGLEGPEYLTWLGDQPEAGYTVLMGATTYRLMHGFATAGEPADGLPVLGRVEGCGALHQSQTQVAHATSLPDRCCGHRRLGGRARPGLLRTARELAVSCCGIPDVVPRWNP